MSVCTVLELESRRFEVLDCVLPPDHPKLSAFDGLVWGGEWAFFGIGESSGVGCGIGGDWGFSMERTRKFDLSWSISTPWRVRVWGWAVKY